MPYQNDPTNPFNELGLFFNSPKILSDEAKNRKLIKGIEGVIEDTFQLGIVSKFIKGKPGELFAENIAGLEKTPGTDRVVPGSGVVINFAPSPIGLMDPKAVGLEPNFYLPDGTIRHAPKVLDRVGLGVPEQRVQDVAASNLEQQKRALQALTIARSLTDEELTDILESNIITTRRVVSLRGFGDFGELLTTAAAVEQQRRNTPGIIRFVPIGTTQPIGLDEQEQFARAVGEVDEFFRTNPPDP